MRELSWLKRELSCLKSLSWKKIISSRIPLFIYIYRMRLSIYRDLLGLLDPFSNATWHDFISWCLITRSCIYDKISWISHIKCQPFISQEICGDSFIFHVIYFNFILSFHVKNKMKIIHGEIWLVKFFCFYINIQSFFRFTPQ